MPLAPRYVPHAVLTVLIAIWSASYAVSKVAQNQLSPSGLVAVRFWLAVLCLLPFLGSHAAADLRQALWPGVAAGLALAAGYLLQMEGLTETSSSTSGLLAGLIVPLVALGGFLFFRAPMRTMSVLGLALAIAGIAAICWPAAVATGGASDTLYGVVLQVASSISYAGHILLLSRFGRSAPVAAFALLQLVLVAVLGSIMAWATGGLARDPEIGVDWNLQLVLLVAYLGVLATAVGIGVQANVQHQIPTTHLALLFALQPLFAALCGYWLLGELLGAKKLAGGGLVVLGVVITSLDRPAAE
jgi:drug/metabolite transporter (DMT)-like permease